MQLASDAGTDSTAKVLVAAKRAGIAVEVAGPCKKTPTGLPIPELSHGGRVRARHINAVLRHIAKTTDCGLHGASFAEEAQVDSWLEWTALEAENTLLEPGASVVAICEVLEAPLKSRTFLVGQRLTLADISLAITLKRPMEVAGFDGLRARFPATVRWLQTCSHQLGLGQAETPGAAGKLKPAVTAAKLDAKPAAAVPKPAAAAAAEPVTSEDAPGSSKKDDKKKAKLDAKKAKEDQKKNAEEERKAAADAKFKGPDVTLDDFEQHSFGNLLVQSQRHTGRKWTTVPKLNMDLEPGRQVWVRARVHSTRKKSAKLCFLVLRQELHTVQAVVFGAEIAGFAGALPDESVVDIYAKVVCPDEPVASCTQSNVELQVEKLFCVGRSQALPLQLADAGRSEVEYEKDASLVRVGQDVRLDNRVIDLRTLANQAIFRIQSGVCALFREYLAGEGFTEIHTPKLISAASEGGADVFKVDYFEGNAYLAQSPQLYKQAALMTDLGRVFEIGPIFRSERSFTHRHMTEFTGLDMEMTFNDHYSEVLDVLDGLFNHMFQGLSTRFRAEIEAVRKQHPFEDLKWKYPCLKIPFRQAIELLRSHGPAIVQARLEQEELSDYERGILQNHVKSMQAHHEEDDISTEDEKVLGKVIAAQYGEEFYMIDKFPKATRPFYTMADPKDPKWTNSYDLFLRGEEITSGAQRIHDPKMLQENAAGLGVDLAPIQWYVDCFKYGAYPHAGGGIGLERVVMLFLNLNNIRKSSMFPRDPKRLTP